MKDLINKLLEKRFEFQREVYGVMEIVNENNISEMSEEITSLNARMNMIDEIIFFIEENIWEDEIEMVIQKQLDNE